MGRDDAKGSDKRAVAVAWANQRVAGMVVGTRAAEKFDYTNGVAGPPSPPRGSGQSIARGDGRMMQHTSHCYAAG